MLSEMCLTGHGAPLQSTSVMKNAESKSGRNVSPPHQAAPVSFFPHTTRWPFSRAQNTQNPILRAISALEELHCLEESSQGVQVYGSIGSSQHGTILVCHPAPPSDRGDSQTVRRGRNASIICCRTRGDHHSPSFP